MKTTYKYLLLAAFGILQVWTLVHLYSKDKMAYVDTSKLMEKTKSMQEVKASIKLKIAEAKAKLDTLGTDFEKEMKRHERELNTMTPSEKKLSEKLLNSKREQVVHYREVMQSKIGQEEQKLIAEALKIINTQINAYGKEEGYTIILATTNGNIAYADNGIDVTDKIVEKLNAQ